MVRLVVRVSLMICLPAIVGCGVQREVYQSVVPSPYTGSLTFCVAPFSGADSHPVLAEGFEGVLFQPNEEGIVFKPKKECDGTFLIIAGAAGKVKFGADPHFSDNRPLSLSSTPLDPAYESTRTRITVLVQDTKRGAIMDNLVFESTSKPAQSVGGTGVLEDSQKIARELIEYLKGRTEEANARR